MERILRLSDLPEPILLHILSKLSDGKEVVRTSVLSTQWRNLWMSVPVSLRFYIPQRASKKEIADFVASVNGELHYWSFCKKIRTFTVCIRSVIRTSLVKHVDMWLHFATKVGNVEEFKLECDGYELPLFAFKNALWKNLVLRWCKLPPSGSVYWTSLASLSMLNLDLAEGVLAKVLFGCPNLEFLEIVKCQGFHQLEISSVKLRKLLIIQDYCEDESYGVLMEIYAPSLQNMQLIGDFCEIHLKNVTSLVSADLDIRFNFHGGENRLEEELIRLDGLLHCVAHVENLELGRWCCQYLPILELKGSQFPPSNWKFLRLNTAFEQLEFPGICSFLQSSSVLETLVIDWYKDEPIDMLSRYTNEAEQMRRFERHNFESSFLHVKTIKIINFDGLLSGNSFVVSLVKCMLRHAVALEKLMIAARYEEHDMSQDDVKVAEEFLRFPRSSPHASVVFSYRSY